MSKDNSWIVPVFIFYAMFCLALAFAAMMTGCSPKVIVQKEVVTEYRDRIVHDTTTVEIPYEVEKVVTRDTASHLENTYAKSDAVVSGGFLSHSLESRPQIIKVPVEVHVTDTLIKEAEIHTETVEVEKPLSWWQKFRIDAFWLLVAALLWIFRKPLLKLLKLCIPL